MMQVNLVRSKGIRELVPGIFLSCRVIMLSGMELPI